MRGKILITGGAGYIGKCTAVVLRQHGYTPVALDNYSTSRKGEPLGFEVFETDLTDIQACREVWKRLGAIEGVIHFAARALVPESVDNPELYFRNNLLSTVNVAQCCVEFAVPALVHSSSCTVYGVPDSVPIAETAPLRPLTPYGEAKLASERILEQYRRHKGLGILNLRYFNPAGAIFQYGRWFGESHEPETHAIPNVVWATLSGGRFNVYGNDYDTPDGTGVRDYIHIEDLAGAHLNALDYLMKVSIDAVPAVNVGNGRGNSVLELVETAQRVLEKKLNVSIQPRRPGDPPALVADPRLAKELLRWAPQKTLEDMIRSHADYLKSKGG